MDTQNKVIKPETAVQLAESPILSLLERAVQSNVSIESLRHLMDLYERYKQNEAKQLFYDALTGFQSECPPIKRTAKVSYKDVKYWYAPLGEISETIKPYLDKYGLSYRWEFDMSAEDEIKVTCIVSHTAGYSVATSMKAKLDTSGNKSDIHARGSTLTYLERYTLVGALGLATADDDNDAVTEDLKMQFENRMTIWDKDDFLRMRASYIGIKEDYERFLNDIPNENQVMKFKQLIEKLPKTPETEQLKDKLWDNFQRQYVTTADKWLQDLENSKIFNKLKEKKDE